MADYLTYDDLVAELRRLQSELRDRSEIAPYSNPSESDLGKADLADDLHTDVTLILNRVREAPKGYAEFIASEAARKATLERSGADFNETWNSAYKAAYDPAFVQQTARLSENPGSRQGSDRSVLRGVRPSGARRGRHSRPEFVRQRRTSFLRDPRQGVIGPSSIRMTYVAQKWHAQFLESGIDFLSGD